MREKAENLKPPACRKKAEGWTAGVGSRRGLLTERSLSPDAGRKGRLGKFKSENVGKWW